ncbi:helix-turn-helix domain-containing protein [Paenibacillus sp. 203]|uniref:helix-turn-helix domain-containing protein n=1 Tax=Paenibacillus sp. 203 TaxID=3096765 RepID=UPI003FA7216B
MSNTTAILTEITKYMEDNQLILSDLARKADMNPGTMSSIINGNRTLSVDQLDRITEAMGHPVGHYYERYVTEYLTEANPNWRRMSPFIHNCAKLNKLDCIHEVVNLLMDKLGYLESLFELAEELFKEELHEAAAILFENVAVSEKKQYSERLAFCQYRLFTIRIGNDQSRNFEVACYFQPYVERLDEVDQLDALKDLTNVYRSLREWDKVEENAKKIKIKAEIQYTLSHEEKRNHRGPIKKTRGLLFGYIAYADLLCAASCEAREDYERALQYTYAYTDLGWVKETDAETRHWVSLFQHWAQGNMYVYKLLSGDTSVLQEYVEYVNTSSNESERELIAKLMNIMIVANQHGIKVDDILQRFKTKIDSFMHQSTSTGMYAQQVVPEQLARLEYELAYYYLNQGMYSDGFKYLMNALTKANILKNEAYLINCIGLFSHFWAQAVPETKEEYFKFIEEVWLGNAKKIGSTRHRN